MCKNELLKRIEHAKETAKYHGDYSISAIAKAKYDNGKLESCDKFLKQNGFYEVA